MRSNEGPIFGDKFKVFTSKSSLRAVEPARHDPDPKPGEAGEETLRIRQLERLQQHRDLDDTIAMLSEADAYDELLIARLKKRKLQIKDEIARIERVLPRPADGTDPAGDRVIP
jgi:hypothetical protein